MKRLALLFVLLAAACGSKSKPAATTPDPAMETEAGGAEGGSDGATDDEAEADGAKQGAPAPDDPCGGGE